MSIQKVPVFNIVHGSFVDGWGTRTTVFLKGCPLKCAWCCNPEGQKVYPELKYTSDDCILCGKCLDVCPKRAIMFDEQTNIVEIDRSNCDDCLKCLDVCPTNALGKFGEYYSVDELFHIVERDQMYFNNGGGVTIGGGEATFFPDFTLEFIRKCKRNYIHTALDTCGYITGEKGIQALEEADLVLFDIKGMDDSEHIKNTGVSNKIIHENLLYRDSLRKEIIVRIPVIPGYTDSSDNLNRTADFLAELKSVKRVDVLPVHKYGALKYEQLGIPYAIKDAKTYTEEEEGWLKEIFEKRGLRTQIGG